MSETNNITQNRTDGDSLDLTAVFKTIIKGWKWYLVTLPLFVALGVLIALSIPRYYKCEVKLAPELSGEGGSLSSLMSQFGLGDASKSEDAISPNLYPDLMESQEFMVSLCPVPVHMAEENKTTTYYDYLKHHQKSPWWSKWADAIAEKFKSDEELKNRSTTVLYPNDSYRLSKEEFETVKAIKGKLKYEYDKKYGTISISVTDQDPQICALITDTISSRLQKRITEYRTKKAKDDMAYTEQIYQEAKKEYDVAAQAYTVAVDANWDLVDETTKLQHKRLENEMNIKYQAYSSIAGKLQMAKAKVQENTPVFTILQGASVPSKPEGPKRMIIVIGFFMAGFVLTSIVLIARSKD